MTPIEYLKIILVSKQKDGVPLESYSPLMINRWLSFVCPTATPLLNELNKSPFLDDRRLHFDFCIAALPRIRFLPRFHYVKRKKNKEETKESENLSRIAQNLELSERETSDLLQAAAEISSILPK